MKQVNGSSSDASIPDNSNTPSEKEPTGTECGLSACLYALKSHQSDVHEVVYPLVLHFSKNNYMELFNHHLQVKISDRNLLMAFIHDFMVTMQASSLFHKAIVESGVMDAWVNLALRQSDVENMNLPNMP